MQLKWIPTDKKRFLPLLLLADEQESMIDRYLMRGTMYAAYEGEEVIGVAVLVRQSQEIYELKNFVVAPAYQGKGIGKQILIELCEKCRQRSAHTMRVGTGESPKQLAFYKACGFTVCGREIGFFTHNYDHPIIEDGIQLQDMIYLEKLL